MPNISDTKILIVATDGFEESELFGPREILIDCGADVKLASPGLDPIQATVHDDPGKTIRPDMLVGNARASDFDALILPGGVRNPDALRTNKAVIALIRDFAASGKPVAAICHGPWLLVEADLVRGRTLTSWPSLQTDIRNAAGNWVDAEVQVCTNGPNTLVSSRKPDDLPAFCEQLVKAFQHQAA